MFVSPVLHLTLSPLSWTEWDSVSSYMYDSLVLARLGGTSAFSWLILGITGDWTLSLRPVKTLRHLFKSPDTRTALWAALPVVRYLSRGLAKRESLSEPERGEPELAIESLGIDCHQVGPVLAISQQH